MLDQNCPTCGNRVSFYSRLSLIYKFYGQCNACGSEYLPHKKSMVLSSGVLGAIVAILSMSILKFDFLSAMGISVLLVFILQQLINPFYSLNALDDD